MPKQELNNTTEDYLRAIFRLEERDGVATNAELSRELGISAPAASEMVRKMATQKLVQYRKYRGATLTRRGKDAALMISRRHRLWEVFLIRHLGFAWDQVHDHADLLEHVAAPELIDRLDEFLGHPSHDPHGDPIPGADGSMPERNLITIAEIADGKSGTIRRVSDEFPELLRYAASLGLQIGSAVEVIERISFDGSVRLRTEGGEVVVSEKLAASVSVEPEESEEN
jgi:DtxR family Mn-dependent transcriptional regulator